MIINEMNLPIRDLVAQHNEDDSSGRVFAMSGHLDVRPEYQREFVYDEIYFVRRPDDTYEVLDGQQRILSICRYITNSAISARIPAATGGFNMVNFNNLDTAAKEDFLGYTLRVYIYEGTNEEKQDWFQIISIAGEILEQQEACNALYHSPWITNAKNADELWNYFEAVFEWVQRIFGTSVDKSMKGVPWGFLYDAYKDDNLDPSFLQIEVKRLLADSEVEKKSGIYAYLLTGEEKHLNIRQFDSDVALSAYHAQGGKCALCGPSKDF